MFSSRSVCLFACLSGGVGHGPGTNDYAMSSILVTIRITGLPEPGVRSPKSAFTGLSKKLPTDFDEILWTAWVWPSDQLITFWCRSANSTPFTANIHYLQSQRPRIYTMSGKK